MWTVFFDQSNFDLDLGLSSVADFSNRNSTIQDRSRKNKHPKGSKGKNTQKTQINKWINKIKQKTKKNKNKMQRSTICVLISWKLRPKIIVNTFLKSSLLYLLELNAYFILFVY